MRALTFEESTWEDYEKLRRNNKGLHDKLCNLIKQLLRDPDSGSGKPKMLKYKFGDVWSRRLNQKDRVVYKFTDDYVSILSISGHYASN